MTVVAELAQPIVAAQGLELVDVEFVKEGGHWFLRLYIDKEGGVSLDDCQTVSQAVGARLDEVDLIPQRYYLEVSSPGIERPLKEDRDFARFRGHLVEISTFAPLNGEKHFIGELLDHDADSIRLRLTQGRDLGREMAIGRDKVARARLHVEF